jgi:hypothetical protein
MELKKGIWLIYLHLMLFHGKVHCCYYNNMLLIWNGQTQAAAGPIPGPTLFVKDRTLQLLMHLLLLLGFFEIIFDVQY